MLARNKNSAKAVLALTGTALFMIVLDNLIVASALPSIERSLHSPLDSAEWVLDAYILSFAVLILTGAALGERFGRRLVFVIGLVIFTAASAAGALAANIGELVAARAVQGAGSAILMPLTLTLLSNAFPPERRGAALGIWSSIAGLGVAAGPLVGGAITDALSWHWIFWINVPVGVVAILLSPRLLAESRGRREPIDLPGLALVSAGLLGVVWATVRGNAEGWLAASTLGAYAAGIVLLLAFALWELRQEHPMLPLRFFTDRRFSVCEQHRLPAPLRHVRQLPDGHPVPLGGPWIEPADGRRVDAAVDRHAADRVALLGPDRAARRTGAPGGRGHGLARHRLTRAGADARRRHHPGGDGARAVPDRPRHRPGAAEHRRAGHGRRAGAGHRQGVRHAQHRAPARQRVRRGRGRGDPSGERSASSAEATARGISHAFASASVAAFAGALLSVAIVPRFASALDGLRRSPQALSTPRSSITACAAR